MSLSLCGIGSKRLFGVSSLVCDDVVTVFGGWEKRTGCFYSVMETYLVLFFIWIVFSSVVSVSVLVCCLWLWRRRSRVYMRDGGVILLAYCANEVGAFPG